MSISILFFKLIVFFSFFFLILLVIIETTVNGFHIPYLGSWNYNFKGVENWIIKSRRPYNNVCLFIIKSFPYNNDKYVKIFIIFYNPQYSMTFNLIFIVESFST